MKKYINILRGQFNKIWWQNTYFRHSFFGSNVRILGLKNVVIGKGVSISDDCWLNCHSMGKIEIGKLVHIGRGCYLSAGKGISIGDGCLIGSNSKILSQSHEFDDLTSIISRSNVKASGNVCVGDNCWIGESCIVVGTVNIGSFSVIGAGSKVVDDVPAFSLALGDPLKIIKRYDPNKKEWVNPNSIFDEEYDDLVKQFKLNLSSQSQYPNYLPASRVFGWS